MHMVIFTVYWYVDMNADECAMAVAVRAATFPGCFRIDASLNNNTGRM